MDPDSSIGMQLTDNEAIMLSKHMRRDKKNHTSPRVGGLIDTCHTSIKRLKNGPVD
jgi:hypothetical protein